MLIFQLDSTTIEKPSSNEDEPPIKKQKTTETLNKSADISYIKENLGKYEDCPISQMRIKHLEGKVKELEDKLQFYKSMKFLEAISFCMM